MIVHLKKIVAKVVAECHWQQSKLVMAMQVECSQSDKYLQANGYCTSPKPNSMHGTNKIDPMDKSGIRKQLHLAAWNVIMPRTIWFRAYQAIPRVDRPGSTPQFKKPARRRGREKERDGEGGGGPRRNSTVQPHGSSLPLPLFLSLPLSFPLSFLAGSPFASTCWNRMAWCGNVPPTNQSGCWYWHHIPCLVVNF